MAKLATVRQAILVQRVESRILLIRGEKVMLDRDLAALYQVSTKAVNQAVRRNPDRFPVDFMFQLTAHEVSVLRSQTVTSNVGRGGDRYFKGFRIVFVVIRQLMAHAEPQRRRIGF